MTTFEQWFEAGHFAGHLSTKRLSGQDLTALVHDVAKLAWDDARATQAAETMSDGELVARAIRNGLYTLVSVARPSAWGKDAADECAQESQIVADELARREKARSG